MTKPQNISSPAARRWPYVVVGLAILLYLIAYSWLSITRHQTFNSTGLDLGIYDQAIWNSAHGRWFAASVETDNLLGDHTDFGLLLYVPLFWIWPDVRLLLVAQTVILASGAAPIFWLARRRLNSEPLAACLSCLYLLYPAVGFINRYDFHPEVIILPALLWALVFIEQKRWLPTAICLTLTMLCKEYLGLEIAGYGLYILLYARDDKHMRWLGIACLVLGPLWTAAMVGWVIPHFRSGLPANFTERYLWFLGHNAPDSAELTFLLFTKSLFVVELLAPLLFIPLLVPRRLVPMLIPLGIVLLSRAPAQASVFFQYMAEFIPALFAATIFGLEHQIERFRASSDAGGLVRKRQLLVFSLGLSLFAYWIVRNPLFSNVPPIYYAVVGPQVRSNSASLESALRLIPAEGCVVSSNNLLPHLSHRQQIFLLNPLGYTRPWPDTCDYLIADLRENRWGDDRAVFQALVASGRYTVVFDKDDVVVARIR